MRRVGWSTPCTRTSSSWANHILKKNSCQTVKHSKENIFAECLNVPATQEQAQDHFVEHTWGYISSLDTLAARCVVRAVNIFSLKKFCFLGRPYL